jgi:hypothetical protein
VAEQRRNKRFELKLPLELVRSGSERISEMCETKNVSSCGVLFRTDTPMKPGQPLEYLITLPGSKGAEVRLRCMGKVIRHASEVDIAATLERYEFVRDA